jgi:hypothetical protein
MKLKPKYYVASLIVAALAAGSVNPASGYVTSDNWYSNSPSFNGQISFAVVSRTLNIGGTNITVTPPTGVVDGAEAAWERFGNLRSTTRVSSSVNEVFYATSVQLGGLPAAATSQCSANSTCRVRISYEPAVPWHATTTCNTNPSRWDMQSTVTHEFGHWYGSHHSSDVSGSGRNESPTMDAGAEASCRRRTIEQDDANIALHGAAGVTNIASNWGLEDSHSSGSVLNGDLHWKFLPSSNGTGSATRYLDSLNSYQGNAFIQFNSGTGSAASVYQDIYPRGAGVTTVTASVRVKNNTGSTQQVQLVVWDLDTTPVSNVVNCSIAPSSGKTYYECAGSFSVTVDWVRVQIYNYTNGNVSIDNFRMTAND